MSGAVSQLQSVLSPAGPTAATIAVIGWVLIIGAGVIFTGVMVLLVLALRRPATARPLHERLWIIGGGVVFPLVVLTALLVWSLSRTPGWMERPPPGALVVSVTAHLWWWEVRYRDPATGQDVTLANELHVPAGQPVWLGLNSPNVIHSFWVPALGGKMDMVPGRVSHLMVQADQPGSWRGQCAEYCGEQHARMALHVIAKPPEEFAAWLAAQAKPAAPPTSTLLASGREAFLVQRCNACHAVRGVAEGAGLGPDLTHVGSRFFLGAGTLPNLPGSMAHWVAHTQDVKPGARMPSSNDMDAGTLAALAAWLEHLK
ncbi:MAG: cytochrome c oxidase subunit II [Polaromonas sp.]|nr:cytochrome c oxidase subunit II [Polaromonas sp.]